MNDISKMLPPDHPMYTDAMEALKRYHQAQAEVSRVPILSACGLSLSIVSKGLLITSS